MSRRLITFGCSFTYGQGLPNCQIGNNWSDTAKTPSKMSWPFELGKLLDIPVINKGVPGASNTEILYHVLNFNFESNDTVVLMWSMPNRDLYFLPNQWRKKPFRQMGIWLQGKNPFVDRWLKKTTEVDNVVKSWLYMHHAELYLNSKNINFIHFPINAIELEKFKPDYVNLTNYFNNGFEFIDECINDKHPGIKSHKKTAHTIYKILNDQKGVINKCV
jgi:hypothetical protein